MKSYISNKQSERILEVLVVDDNYDYSIVSDFRRVFEKRVNFEGADTAKGAVEFLQRKRYDVVILDFNLDWGIGFGLNREEYGRNRGDVVAHEIKRISPKTKIFGLSSSWCDELAVSAGLDGYGDSKNGAIRYIESLLKEKTGGNKE